MLKKLKVKFVCFTMAIVSLMLCVIFATVYSSTSRSLEAESVRMMEAIGVDPFRLGSPNQAAEQVRLPYFALQIGPFGEVVASGGGYFDLSDTEFLQEVIGAAIRDGGDTGVLRDYDLRYCWVRSRNTSCLVVADMSSERTTLRGLLEVCAAIGAVSLLAFLGLSLLLARWALRPVERAWEQQRQFVADASHELKTPLTVILTDAELLQDPETNEADRARFSGGILTMARQMRGLVEDLLELARLDAGTAKRERTELDFSELCAQTLLPFEPLFFEKGLELQSRVEPGIRVRGDGEHLRQVEEILLDNALKYAAVPSAVELRLARQGRNVRLSVASRGDALSKEELKDIFKRFYRADRARSRGGGYGLGLAIAGSIAAEHGGKIWAESEGGVNTFIVELPGL